MAKFVVKRGRRSVPRAGTRLASTLGRGGAVHSPEPPTPVPIALPQVKKSAVVIPPAEALQEAPDTGANRRILSFALFQLRPDDTRAIGLYHRALPAVLRATRTLAPGWTVVIHHDDSVLEHPYGPVLRAAADRGLIELHAMPKPTELCKAMLWRMRPCWFNDVEIVACRDMDSLFLPRDRIALEAFAASDAWVHALLDNQAHAGLMGGMSAYKVSEFRRLFPMSYDEWLGLSSEEWTRHGADQLFLGRVVWAKMHDKALVHQIAGRSVIDLPIDAIGDVTRETLVQGDTLAPYCGAAGFDVERAVSFYDTQPATARIRALEKEFGYAPAD